MERQSNFELLRMTAILMVLVLHADFFSLKGPIASQIMAYPLDSTLRIWVQFLTVGAVNIFVMVSGWFGIRHSVKGITNLLFQTFFYLFLTFGVTYIFGSSEISLESVKMLTLISGNWFVKAYLILYLIAPALNLFCETVPRHYLKIILISYLGFMFFYGWAFHTSAEWISEGYSPVWFIGLYLTTRYMNIYRPTFMLKTKSNYVIALITLVTLMTAICVSQPLVSSREAIAGYIFLFYTSPTTFISALLFIIITSKLKISSKFVNLLGRSSFAVYLVFCSPFILPIYGEWFRSLNSHFRGFTYWAVTILMVVSMYGAVTVFDTIRISIWNKVIRRKSNDILQKYGKF